MNKVASSGAAVCLRASSRNLVELANRQWYVGRRDINCEYSLEKLAVQGYRDRVLE